MDSCAHRPARRRGRLPGLLLCQVLLLAAAPIDASGAGQPTYSLTVRTAGSGRGRVTIEPKAERYAAGTAVKLTAVASGGNVFRGWSEAVPDRNRVSATILLTRDTEIVATFDASGLDPIPERIRADDLAVELVDFARIPSSLERVPGAPADPALRGRGYFPAARINALKPFRDGSGRLMVEDQRGLLYAVDAGGSVQPYLDVSAVMPDFTDWPGLTAGLNAVAIAPDFVTSGHFYTVHSERPGARRGLFRPTVAMPIAAHFVLVEWTAGDPRAGKFTGEHREVLRLEAPDAQHGIQDIGFDPSLGPADPGYGMLFVLVGEGTSVWQGSAGNVGRNDSVFGTVLRIDPRGTDGRGGSYGTPSGNPFAARKLRRAFPEVWATGFRNPHKLSWDAGGDRLMFVSDVGESNLEEVNVVLPGLHYGWPWREGTWILDPAGDLGRPSPPTGQGDRAHLIDPVMQFDHDEGSAVSGGYVYRARTIPGLTGRYVFGDIGGGRVFVAPIAGVVNGRQLPLTELRLQRNGRPTTLADLVGSRRVDLHFGTDADGEIYLLTKADGVIRRLAPSTHGHQR